MGSKILNFLQSLGRSLMLPIAVLPIAGIMLRLGQGDLLDWPIMASAGSAIFDHLPLLFAIGVAIGFSVDAAGAAALSGVVAYLTLTTAVKAADSEINMGVLAGIVSGIIGGVVYNHVHKVKLPPYLAFFSGKRCAPICSALCALVFSFLFIYIWPPIQTGINHLGQWMLESGAIGAAVFGVLNRLLLSVGLHQILNTLCWFQFGTFTTPEGTIVMGDLNRFFAGDPSAGVFMSGFFPIMIFGLPAVALAIYFSARKERRPEIGGMLFSLALTAFLTGITEPLEYLFMFLAPLLYLFHAIFTGLSMAVCELLNYKAGFTFSAGMIDLMLSWGKATNRYTILWLGPLFFLLYFFVFYGAIKLFKLKTPGREDEQDATQNPVPAVSADGSYRDLALGYAKALGGFENLKAIDNCITRLRLQVIDMSKINESELKRLGASGVIKMGATALQVIVGSQVEFVADAMRALASGQEVAAVAAPAPVVADTSDETGTDGDTGSIEVFSPVEGKIVALEDVPDVTFSQRLAGDGVAIQPEGNVFTAPISGTIISLPSSGHAVVIRHRSGAEILVHIGLDTVELKGEGFRIFARKGMQVKAGTPLIQANWEKITAAKKITISPILIANPDQVKNFRLLAQAGNRVKPGSVLFRADADDAK
mgnify:CR=1 FL=1